MAAWARATGCGQRRRAPRARRAGSVAVGTSRQRLPAGDPVPHCGRLTSLRSGRRWRRDDVPAAGGAADAPARSAVPVDAVARQRRTCRALGGRHRSRPRRVPRRAHAQPRARRPARRIRSPHRPRRGRGGSTTSSSAPRGSPAPPPHIATATPTTPRSPGSTRPFSSPHEPASEPTPGTPPSAKVPRCGSTRRSTTPSTNRTNRPGAPRRTRLHGPPKIADTEPARDRHSASADEFASSCLRHLSRAKRRCHRRPTAAMRDERASPLHMPETPATDDKRASRAAQPSLLQFAHTGTRAAAHLCSNGGRRRCLRSASQRLTAIASRRGT